MKSGSILIEIIISLFLLMICVLLSINICEDIIRSTSKRYDKELLNESLYSVCSEIRYNTKLSDIQNRLSIGPIFIKYDDNFMETISNHELLTVDTSVMKNDFIKISEEGYINDSVVISVTIQYNGTSVNQKLTKAMWMDEV